MREVATHLVFVPTNHRRPFAHIWQSDVHRRSRPLPRSRRKDDDDDCELDVRFLVCSGSKVNLNHSASTLATVLLLLLPRCRSMRRFRHKLRCLADVSSCNDAYFAPRERVVLVTVDRPRNDQKLDGWPVIAGGKMIRGRIPAASAERDVSGPPAG